MPVKLIQGNILDATTDGLILTIDGAKRGLEGNLARAYARRWPDSFEEIGYEIPYPLPLGRTIPVRLDDDSPFRYVLIASTLHHLDTLDERQKVVITTSAFREAIALARRFRLRTLATTVMSGGWRLPFRSAFNLMLREARPLTQEDSALSLYIYVRDEADLKDALVQADSIAFPLRSP